MKIQHWALIFIIIILPFSIICRNTISKKNVLIRDETRINNIIDNATYDAVLPIMEISEEFGYGKNIPITKGVAEEAINRFFNTLSVNFNLPIGLENAEEYFDQYIPAIVIVGYDGLYVYSCEEINNEYKFSLKPKIPYAYTYQYQGDKEITIHFTLDNYVSIYFPDEVFLIDAPDANGNLDTDGTHVLSGYIGEPLDVDSNGIDDLNDWLDEDTWTLIECTSGDANQYTANDDPYGIGAYTDTSKKIAYIKNTLPMFTENLSYILQQWNDAYTIDPNWPARHLGFLYAEDANQDYEYDEYRNVIASASDFHLFRRETIINLITSVLTEEFNEHNYYTKMLGITYEFNLPDIAREDWNNTIDDISVLAFFQGMPIGYDSYYNNYALGGTRIVQATYIYAETVWDENGDEHQVYHKEYCYCIPRDQYGNILYSAKEADGSRKKYVVYWDKKLGYYREQRADESSPPSDSKRITTGIEQIFINANEAKDDRFHLEYYICSECM